MSMDSQGKHRPNPQLARRADRMHSMRSGGGSAPKPGMPDGGDRDPMASGEEKESVGSVTVHDHGDGTMHSEHSDGSRVEHPDVTHMAAHLMAHHAPGDKHMAMKHDGIKGSDSHAGEDGAVEGPHDHPDAESMGSHAVEHMGGDGGGEVPQDDEEDGYDQDMEYGV